MTPSRKSIVALRYLVLAIACVATLLAAFVLVENWRGDRAWQACEQELKTRGEPLDFAAFRPASVASEENFFAAPKFKHILYDRPDDPVRATLLAETRLKEFHVLQRHHGNLKDFTALRLHLQKAKLLDGELSGSVAADVLRALRPLEPLFNELREAARSRPKAALEPRATPLAGPQIDADMVYRLAHALGVRASAHIDLGRSADAYADIFALQRLANAVSAQPETLLHLLVGVAMQGLAAGAIADGSQRHVWTDPQLAQFQRSLDELRPLAGLRHAMRSERAQVLYVVDARPAGAMGETTWPWWLFHGWRQQNKTVYCRRLDADVFSAIRTDPDRIVLDPKAGESRPADSRPSLRSPYSWISGFALTNVHTILGGLGTTADQLRLASLACAMERHRLVRGDYPAALDELVPRYVGAVPRGITDSERARYGTGSDGKKQAYFVGPNKQDEQGAGDDIKIELPSS